MITPDDLLAKLDESEELEKLENVIDTYLKSHYMELYNEDEISVYSSKMNHKLMSKLLDKYKESWDVSYFDGVYFFKPRQKSILDKFLEFFNKGK